MTNNSNATTENIVNDNAVYNIVNQVVKCDCNTAKHDPADYECACEDCLDEQVDRLNEQLVAKAIADTEQRIIKLLEDSEVRAKWIEATSKSLPTYQGVVDFFTSLIKGEQK